MRISVNLATRPFVELRPLYARLRLAMGVLAVLAVLLLLALQVLNVKARTAQAKMDALKAKTARFVQERQANEARMRQPQNMAVLQRSQFLNEVFARKSFSWTAVMMDLEKVLPGGVQVTSIEPVISKEGDVNIRLRVSGDRDRAVQLVRNLETSQRFVFPRLAGEAAQTQEGNRNTSAVVAPGTVEFDILSGYNPLPMPAAKKEKDAGKKVKSDDSDDSAADAAGDVPKTHKKVAPKKTAAPAAVKPSTKSPKPLSKPSGASKAMTPTGGAR
jgi:type IV pilus assembly protein PilN